MNNSQLFNHYFDRATAALRRGEEGEVNFALQGVADYLMTNITLTGKLVSMDVVSFVTAFSQAQVQGDWVRLADMLEYELPRIEDVKNFPYLSVRLRAEPSGNYKIGQSIRFVLDWAPTQHPILSRLVKDVEFAFYIQYLGDKPGSDCLDPRLVQGYSDKPEWVWFPQGPAGIYRIKAALKRSALDGSHLQDVEDIIDIHIKADFR